MHLDPEELFLTAAREMGFLTLGQTEELRKAVTILESIGIKHGFPDVAREKRMLSSEQVRSIRNHLRKSGVLPKLARYEVITKIGEGGMGTVYKARDTTLDRLVALKILRREHSRNSHYLQRFIREAKLASRIQHPNAVTIYEAGEAGGRHYIAMEFVEGESLASRIVKEGRLTEHEALKIGVQICGALVEAHN